jgi:hypothetical protein
VGYTLKHMISVAIHEQENEACKLAKKAFTK